MESLLGGGDRDGSIAVVGGGVALAEIVGLNGGIVSADLFLQGMLDQLLIEI